MGKPSLTTPTSMDVSRQHRTRSTGVRCHSSSSCINTSGPHSAALLTPIACNCQARSAGELGIGHECALALDSVSVS